MTSTPLPERAVPSIPQVALYALVAAVVIGVLASLGGVSASNRDLADNDSYMRYLRVEALATEGAWFNPVFERSNYPHGEELHWTRPVDVYVLTIGIIARPLVGSDWLYWGSWLSAPLLLLALGPLTYWAVGAFVPRSIRWVLMPALLVQPVLMAYFGFGRVDHHASIMVCFVWTLGLFLDLLRAPTGWRVALLAISLALGMWVSTEFLVPWALVAGTLALGAASEARRGDAVLGARVFGATTGAVTLAMAVERGWSTAVEYDRISVVHVALAASATMVFYVAHQTMSRTESPGRRRRALALIGSVGLAVLLVSFPGLAKGPFAEVDPLVRDRWLVNVVELHPIRWSDGPGLLLFRALPLVLGVGSWFAIKRRRPDAPHDISVVFWWLVAYSMLTLLQFRWALFAQFLSLPLVLAAAAPVYEKIGDWRAGPVVRPATLAMILALPILGAAFARTGQPEVSADSVSCSLDRALGQLRGHSSTTVLADIDIGPEILYRTDHRVVATPYHRNTNGIRDLIEIMAATDDAEVERRLAARSVGLVLVCPTTQDLTYPDEPVGSFYEALVTGSPPPFATPVPLPPDTDYLLFAVSS